MFVQYGPTIVSPGIPIIAQDALQRLKHNLQARPPHRSRLVACAQVRDMTNAAQVWVAFHLLQGFEKFVFYDDGSEPALQVSDFGLLAEWVTVKRWNTYSASNPANNRSQQHIGRQWLAFVDCLDGEMGNNSYVALFDVDEFFWSCDVNYHFSDVVASFGKTTELHMSRCPRFGGVSLFNPTVPVISQLVRRSPALLNEPVVAVRASNPDCDTLYSVDEPRGMCYPATAEKSIFNMKLYTPDLHKFLTIHGLRAKNGENPPMKPVKASEWRTRGLCCNHYIVRDNAEAAWKAVANHNDFYKYYLQSEGVRAFYNWTADTSVRDLWAPSLVSLLQDAGLNFTSN